ncbi:DUF1735 and LamG domain-containing protein [Bacteroides zhangwenhongii]|uniref:DUF1735 and LamG domain-containing protein n=1 Tax=Bacteroides zhangwenhongii TaxID=2650157 RepID=A0ABT5H7T4_9BACE|nr:DUF1735 and LamG domain-containing protein [Bacteroides zhangwenhongii]MDC7136574.1 DUF1735 and LamG domain-containing protein [Bacteroides zhangwenhongii]OKZ23457.1 MAG: hypothetical protein BHV74_06815 [Bacteroides finegoldii]
MRIHKLYQCLAAATLLFLPVACDNTDYSDHSPFDNSAYLNVAATKNAETFTFNRKVTSQTKTFTVKLSYPLGEDVKVNLKVDPSLIAVYNAKNDTHYEMLSAEHYQLSQESVTIPAGKITSDEVSIKFLKLDELEIDATYLCPLSISGAEGVGVMDGSRTMYYLVRRSSAITTAINLKNVYVTVPGFDKGSPTADVVNNLSAVTMEAIIRVNSFQPEISSIMGIEMYLQMRLGDASFPNQQLQVQTTYGKFPDASKQKLLLAGEWYHVALTWDLATTTIAYYVNGQLQSISTSHGKSDLTSISLGDKEPDDEFGNGGDHNFYFGRSYTLSHDLSRQFDGEICEARIWSVARTQEQIYQSMYDIPNPATEPTLRAYWKFDEGTGLEVEDRTGHGNNAKVVPYWKDSNHTEAYSKADAELWPSGIEVPKINNEQ